ncbi:hypothetical protein N7582_002301 [Saccharomyces uvarum]|uniref:Glycerophosphocholine acyltransferase 1 n=1 Tax=Saccharomyces uvarum TaxID=230603 RepID=A0AA35JK53_SACUV|nr:hypothetical protein N7582_002301 [Saccharomyces uvarum]CAI4063118.1 hypothetical protein SUVC_07G3790 [Saccharomyces uvarum]
MKKLDNDEMEDETNNSVSLTSLLEFLDPIASKVVSKYYHGSNLSKAEQKLRNFEGFRRRKPHNNDRHSHPHYLNRSRSFLQLEDFKVKALQRIKNLDEPLDSIFFKNSSRLEKAFYPFTLFNVFFIGFLMGRFPEWFHIYYTILFFVLMPIRFYTYYKTRNHYFLADFCYFVNILCLLFIWVFPHSSSLFQSCFAFTFGTLCFAVITWRNSLVIHSIDKTTSCFIHIIPPCVMYVIYHVLPLDYKINRFPGAIIQSSLDIKKNILWTSLYYLIWQCLYHYFITLKKSNKIKSGERMTSFEYLTTHQFKNFWAVKLRSPWPMVIYTLSQYFYQLFTMLLCGIWIRYKLAAALFLIIVFLWAAHNGATYYIDHYGKNFEKEVDRLRLEVENLQQKLQPDSDTVSDVSVNDKEFLTVNHDEEDGSSSTSSKSI